jgi:anti-anti-sigma factor
LISLRWNTISSNPRPRRLGAVDLTQVEMMGSQALGMLINLRKEALANKGKVVLFGLNDDLQEMLKITRLSAIFTVAKDKSAAIAAMA